MVWCFATYQISTIADFEVIQLKQMEIKRKMQHTKYWSWERLHSVNSVPHFRVLSIWQHVSLSSLILWFIVIIINRSSEIVIHTVIIPLSSIQEKTSNLIIKQISFDAYLTYVMSPIIARSCFFELRCWASMRWFLKSTATATHISAFALSKNDYWNILFGSSHDVKSNL